ncbi:YqgE/AlgH family protein [Acetobacter farinalis]|uniref:UPF0301 protein OQ252_07890 n=1 Tax=Acetobacter farinalis TaxID=1260984 RepID=A0ABT3Q7P2_9PROT|nr:YqgE/AlgH family protein [Acetobacter farinalis]MCX2561313.1 YqgE/AlgH family protein [Acetobacter farinalis]NHO29917.1 hypothetical protein [Acetobacter farinalis]
MVFPHASLLEQSARPGGTLAGLLLVATPALSVTQFDRSVIYLCAHASGEGAMGLVINRRLPRPGFEELLEQLDIEPSPPLRRLGLCAGGPVEEMRGFVLHSSDWKGEGSMQISEAATLTASLDVLNVMAKGGGPQDALLAMGHASWEAGQLEEEIFQHDAWLLAPFSREVVFGHDHTAKWRQALALINIDPIRLTSRPGHA